MTPTERSTLSPFQESVCSALQNAPGVKLEIEKHPSASLSYCTDIAHSFAVVTFANKHYQYVTLVHKHISPIQLIKERNILIARGTSDDDLKSWTRQKIDDVKLCIKSMETSFGLFSDSEKAARNYMQYEDSKLLSRLHKWVGIDISKEERVFSYTKHRTHTSYENTGPRHGPFALNNEEIPELCHYFHATFFSHEQLNALQKTGDLTSQGFFKALRASVTFIQGCQLDSLDGQLSAIDNSCNIAQLGLVMDKDRRTDSKGFEKMADCFCEMIDDDSNLLEAVYDYIETIPGEIFLEGAK